MTTTRRRTVAVTVTALSTLALVGGTLAQFTDSDTTTDQILTAGTVAVDLVEGAGWADNLDNLAVGDTATRTALVDNTSTLDIGAMRLSADLSETPGPLGGRLSEAVTVDIAHDTDGPGGDPAVVLVQDVRLADLADGYDLTFPGALLPAGTDVDLVFDYEVVGARPTATGDRTRGARDATAPAPVNPDNAYQGASLTVAYTIDAVQRAAFDDRQAVAPDAATATLTGNETANVAFTAPESNPEGTVYRVTTVEDPTKTGWGLSSPVAVTGLTPRTTYVFAVTATGPNGVASEPVLTDPLTIPAATYPVMAWGYNSTGTSTVPTTLGPVVQVAGGSYHSLALRADGTVTGWGSNSSGEIAIPFGLTGVTQVDGGDRFSVALKSDGTVVAWGSATENKVAGAALVTNATQIDTGYSHTLALRANGTVTAWGANTYGQSTVPGGLSNVKQVAAGRATSLALSHTGSVSAWGQNIPVRTVPVAAQSNVVAIAAGSDHALALRHDGTVVAWGSNYYGETTVPAAAQTGVIAIAAGEFHSIALKTDGTVVVWGRNNFGQRTIPAGLSGVKAIATGWNHNVVQVLGAP